MKLPPLKIPKSRRALRPSLPAPHRPRLTDREEPEVLGGSVQNMKASQPEERFAKALDKVGTIEGYEFRRTIGAPRGLPGWKELDFLVAARGQYYAIEVDSAFSHRDKGRADVLHDAIVLRDLEKDGLQVYPSVIHLHMESELIDQRWADTTAKRLFG